MNVKAKESRWFQLKEAKERYHGSKVKIAIQKYRKQLNGTGKVQIFASLYEKKAIWIKGKYLEVKGFHPKVRYNIQEVVTRLKDYIQLMDLLVELGHDKSMD